MAQSKKARYFLLGAGIGAICGASVMQLMQHMSSSHQALPTTMATNLATVPSLPVVHMQPVRQDSADPKVSDNWIKQEINGLKYYLAPLTHPVHVHQPLPHGPLLEEYPLGCTDVWDVVRLGGGIK